MSRFEAEEYAPPALPNGIRFAPTTAARRVRLGGLVGAWLDCVVVLVVLIEPRLVAVELTDGAVGGTV